MSKKIIALFPASFNPIHNGHAEIIKFAADTYDELILFVANNEIKKYPIIISQRAKLVQEFIDSLEQDNIKVIEQSNTNMLTPLVAKKNNATLIIRGIHEQAKGIIQDKLIEYEANLADSYLEENPDLDFHYIRTNGIKVSSTEVRKLAKNREDISGLVPEVIYRETRTLYE